MEQIPTEAISRHRKGKKVIGNSQHKLTRRKLCQINLATVLRMKRELRMSFSLTLRSLLTVSNNIFYPNLGNVKRDNVEEQLAGLPGSMVVQNVTNSQL